jgi:hypothetical protein
MTEEMKTLTDRGNQGPNVGCEAKWGLDPKKITGLPTDLFCTETDTLKQG